MTDFYETRVENLESKEEKKKSSAAAKKSNKKSPNKRKREDSNSSVVESSKSVGQTGSTVSFTVNAVILQKVARIYVL